MSSRYDFTLQSCHSSRWWEKCSLLQPRPREGAIPLQANLQQVGLWGDSSELGVPTRRGRRQLSPSRAAVNLQSSRLLSQDRLGHRGGVPRGARSASSRVLCVKHIETCLLPPGALWGQECGWSSWWRLGKWGLWWDGPGRKDRGPPDLCLHRA